MVIANKGLQNDIIVLFHASSVGGHSGVVVTFQKISFLVYWRVLKKYVREFVRCCEVYQRHKYDWSATSGLLQPLSTPEGIFTNITMDFISSLPSSKGMDVIFVLVDQLTKSNHFMAISHPYSVATVTQVFIDNVYWLHGLPSNRASDRDLVFMSEFWKELFKQLGVSTCTSSMYHPQTDGQTKVVNRWLETYLRCMMAERPSSWAKCLPLAEWWYNMSFHSTINMSPFEELYGFSPPLRVMYLVRGSKNEEVYLLLRDREESINMLKFHLQRVQNRMCQVVNRKRSD